MSCGLGSPSRPLVEFLSHEWLLTLGTPLVDPRKRQTSTATPAKPGGLPLTLGLTMRRYALRDDQFARIDEQPIEIEPNLAVIARLEAEMTAPNQEQVENVRIHLSGCPSTADARISCHTNA